MTLSDAASALLETSAQQGSPEQETAPADTASSQNSSPSPSSESSAATTASTSISVSVNPSKLGFVDILRKTLDNEELYSGIIAWMPDGTAFTIINHKKFTKEEMPKIFNIRNMSSFVRKLTRFGFTRRFDKATMNSDIFAHEDFVRDHPERASRIQCAPLPKPASVAAAARAMATATSVSSAKTSTSATPPRRMAPFKGHSIPPVPPSQELARRVSLESELSLATSVAQTEDFRSATIYGGGVLVPPSPPRVTASTTAVLSSEMALGAAIESLLRERESLRQGADANTVALVRLLEEQQRVRRREPMGGSLRAASPADVASVLERRVSGVYPAAYYASAACVPPLSLPPHQSRPFPFPHHHSMF